MISTGKHNCAIKVTRSKKAIKQFLVMKALHKFNKFMLNVRTSLGRNWINVDNKVLRTNSKQTIGHTAKGSLET